MAHPIKGRDWETAPMPKGFERLAKYPNLTAAMARAGWSEPRIRKLLGENWFRFLEQSWRT